VNADNLHELQQTAPPVAMALGYFDGVHLGHQKVIAKACEKAANHQLNVAVLSFFPHPKSVLIPGYEVDYLEPIEQKAHKLAALGVDIFYVVEFTKELASLVPNIFLQEYVKGLHAKEIICGFDYKYGQKASGTVETLAVYAATQQIGLTVVEEFLWQGEKISSTRIRHCLKERNVQALPLLLGQFYVTKYCQHTGVLPNYLLPNKGSYYVFIDTEEQLVPCVATVRCQKFVQLHHYVRDLPKIVSIQWIDTYEAKTVYQNYA
jgi:riboflavin kinase / FMN adenylyltransferase